MFFPNGYLIFFINLIPFNFCIQSQIKFFIRNVPTLFRCEKNGRLFYFKQFPTNDELIQTKSPCELTLPTRDQCVHLEIDTLRFGCQNHVDTNRACNYLLFKTPCFADLSVNIPWFKSKVFTEYSQDEIDMIPSEIYSSGSNNKYQVFNSETNSWIDMYTFELTWCCKMKKKNYSMNMGDVRTNQIVFEDKESNVLNMMCEYVVFRIQKKFIFLFYWYSYIVNMSSSMKRTNMYLWSDSIPINDYWSWICCLLEIINSILFSIENNLLDYYPSGSEDPIDHNIVYKAVSLINIRDK